MSIELNLKRIKETTPSHVTLVAVSKTHAMEIITEAYGCGQRDFGENKVQELVGKSETLPKDINWHFIGHLQTNKVKYIAPFVSLIHGVDSFKLLKVIDKEAKKNNRIISCLLQIHIAVESTKFGFDEHDLLEFLKNENWRDLKNIHISGLMGMATFTDDLVQVREEFKSLKLLFDKVKDECFPISNDFKEVSMGMSDDYKIAIEEGSTMVRVGSAIFGER